jgi:pimeloyl-ACP methyl ester carboxylesterase
MHRTSFGLTLNLAKAGPLAIGSEQNLVGPALQFSAMVSIVLIHGSTQNASCWDLVRPHLTSAGHEIFIVELPADQPDATASDFARMAVDQMRAAGNDCVVVAHSASGILLPLIAQLRPVEAVVYLAALIPASGISVIDQFQRDPGMLDPEWVRAGSRWADPSNWRALADEFLFHDVLLSAREAAYSTIRPMRIDAALREPFTFQAGAIPRSLCIVASLDRTIQPEWQRQTWRERNEGQLIGVGGGHCPHISTPRETANAILLACDADRWNRIQASIEQRLKQGCSWGPPDPVEETIDYDTFMEKTELQDRLRLFNAITPENRAEIVRTQVRRWLEANRDRLTAEQIEVMEDTIASIVPDRYRQPRSKEMEKRRDLDINRMYTVFSREDEVWRAMTIRGNYIPRV